MGRRAYSRAILTVAVAAAALVVTLVVATIATGSVLGGPPHHHVPRSTPPGSVALPLPLPQPTLDSPVLLPWLGVLFLILLVAAGLAIFLLAHGGQPQERSRPQYDEDVEPGGGDWEALVSAELGEAAAEQLAALTRGSPRNAIVACWLRLQEVTLRAGLPAEASETSREFTIRALRRLSLDDTAITALSELYREARFSEHEMVEAQRSQAIAALGLLAQRLAPHRTPPMSGRPAATLDSVLP